MARRGRGVSAGGGQGGQGDDGAEEEVEAVEMVTMGRVAHLVERRWVGAVDPGRGSLHPVPHMGAGWRDPGYRAWSVGGRIREMPSRKPSRKSSAQLDHEIADALRGGERRRGRALVDLRYEDADIERMFTTFQKALAHRGGGRDQEVVAILGDPMYVQRFRMPRWNIRPTVLDTPEVAVWYPNELGIPRSKSAHARRADYFEKLRQRLGAEHRRLVRAGEHAYGAHGPVISGGFHEDWPNELKDRIRFVAHGIGYVTSAARLHDALSKSRSPVFQR